ncbi:MAG: hypothetical protein IKQ59_08660 [Prevotella sp.]|nr:hypothetical protein [Prevotella sp.]
MKHYKPFVWMMAIAIAGTTMTACSLDSYEPEKPFTTDPAPSKTPLYACGLPETRFDVEILFTEDDIEWFNVTTREIKFHDMDEPLYKRMEPYHEIQFNMGDYPLFVVSSFVGLWDSRVFTDLVLCYGNLETIEMDGYYLYDCYPLQFINDERVQANIKKNAAQWETFTKYLESKGKLRK